MCGYRQYNQGLYPVTNFEIIKNTNSLHYYERPVPRGMFEFSNMLLGFGSYFKGINQADGFLPPDCESPGMPQNYT